jgi:hypothetical protein
VSSHNDAYASRLASTPTIVTHSLTGPQIPVGQKGSVTASCQKGEDLLSGGYIVDAFESDNVVESYPSALDSWTVTDDNTSGPSWVAITVMVYCLQSGASLHPTLVHATGSGSITASCPGHTVLTGGGFKGTNVSASLPLASGWQVTSSNAHDAYAVCARNHLRAAAPVSSATFTTPSVFGGSAGATAHCGSGQFATAGGFRLTRSDGSTSFAIQASEQVATGSWGVYVYASGYYTTTGNVWAACVIPS